MAGRKPSAAAPKAARCRPATSRRPARGSDSESEEAALLPPADPGAVATVFDEEEEEEEKEPVAKRHRSKKGPETRGRSPAATPEQHDAPSKKQPRSQSAPSAPEPAAGTKKAKVEVLKLKCWRCLASSDKKQWAKHKKYGA
jgi:hypothetical protein